MTVTPQPVPPERVDAHEAATLRNTYDWTAIRIGEWQNWLNMAGQDVSDADAVKASTRVRISAFGYAERHGMRLESRRKDHGRILDLRFTRVVDQ